MYATLGIIACMMMVPLLFRLAAVVTVTVPTDYRELSYAASRHGLRAQIGAIWLGFGAYHALIFVRVFGMALAGVSLMLFVTLYLNSRHVPDNWRAIVLPALLSVLLTVACAIAGSGTLLMYMSLVMLVIVVCSSTRAELDFSLGELTIFTMGNLAWVGHLILMDAPLIGVAAPALYLPLVVFVGTRYKGLYFADIPAGVTKKLGLEPEFCDTRERNT